jgi:hypothetical protein
MRRGDLWQQAAALVEKELADLNPHDDVAIYTFSDRLQSVVEFEREGATAAATKPDLVRQQLKALRPTWATTDLGSALVAVAGDLDTSTDVRQSAAEPQIVVVSDFCKGSQTQALQAFEWPAKVRVILRPVAMKQSTNAYAHLLASEEDAPDAEPRVRVVSAADSAGDQFYVSWRAGDARPAKSPAQEQSATAVYVPPGQSRVVKLPRPAGALLADRLALDGDDHDFDNAFHVVPPKKQTVRLVYIGADAADDAQGMQYYLRLAVGGDPLRQVEVTPLPADDSLGEPLPELVVLTRAVSSPLQAALATYVEQGGTLLIAPADRTAAAAIPALVEGAKLADADVASAGVSGENYLLLGEIDFTHPLFLPFANPRYSDFTKIHFWQHWPLTATTGRDDEVSATTGPGYAVVARFDNGDPAILEQVRGKGRVLALASNWRPDDSQLALSSKFVPLVGGLLDVACGAAVTLPSVAINDPVALPGGSAGAETIVHKPGGKQVKLPAGTSQFTQTDEPGVYRAQAGMEEVQFAVNLAAAESDTAPLDLERLEQLGVKLGTDMTRDERLAQIRQQRDTELEGRQKVWRWLIVGVLGLLIVETWWAGRAVRQIEKPTEEVASVDPITGTQS